MKYILCCCLMLWSVVLIAQDMAFYADVMVTASDATHRDLAAREFEKRLLTELEAENSFDREFQELEWISIQYPEDKAFRTLTWQIEKEKGGFNYRGYLQRANGTIVPFKGNGGVSNSSIDRQIEWTQWEGGLIYNILTVESKGSIQYYLQSFTQKDQFTKRKVLEPVYISEASIELGSEQIFTVKNRGKKARRVVLEYSADTQASINYQAENQLIVMDHLVTMNGRIPDQGLTKVPDGSYRAYQLESDGSWKYIDKLYNETFENPPNQGVTSGGRDLFGRIKN